MDDNGQEQVLVGASSVEAGQAPGRVLIAPWGEVKSSNGDFVVDAEAGRLVVEAFRGHGTDLPVDYEHQSLGGTYSSPSGQAPAAGWIKALRVVGPGGQDDAETRRRGDAVKGEEDAGTRGRGDSGRGRGDAATGTCGDADSRENEWARGRGGEGENRAVEPGLYAEVEWTPAAREKLTSREYRYLSPVVIVRKRDRRMVALHSAALTNKPAIVGMRPIVNKIHNQELEERMSEEDLSRGGEGAGDPVEVLRLRLGLAEESDREAVILAADRRLSELLEQASRREAEERVATATRAGKLVPAQRDWALALALSDPAGFDAWAATAPVVVSLGRTQPPQDGDAGGGRAAVIASARAAFRAEPSLALLTSEEAWVKQAKREEGMREDER